MVASLFAILARNNRDAVIFRRGPSKQVLLIKWDRRKDRFDFGQWFKGRIFERRCDLSPSGKFLVYFAAKHKGPIPTWTAISQPPYLTALALWPNMGTWGGGGLFEGDFTLLLNHNSAHRKLADGFRLPRDMTIYPLGHRPGGGEDNPIYHTRLLRDGWIMLQPGEHGGYQRSGRLRWRFTTPQIYEKPTVRHKVRRLLRMSLLGIFETGGRKYVLDYEILDQNGTSLLKLPRLDWAEWDSNGDLLISEKGKLFRLPWANRGEHSRAAALEIADFNDMTFTEKKHPSKR